MEGERENFIPNLQWFPGHMKKAQRIIEENLKLVDVVIELLDARLPLSSANPMLAEIIKAKPRLVVLNKSDLADARATKRWVTYFREQGIRAVAVDAQKGRGVKALVREVEELARPKTEKFAKVGGKARAARCMILGIPNVGKSSLINRLAGAARTKTADRPGITRAKQWIKIGAQLDLLDTPGILWPKFEDPTVGLKLAFTGAINDDIFDREAVVLLLLDALRQNNAYKLKERFKLKEELPESAAEILELIGRKRGCLLKGSVIDSEKAQQIVMTEFRSGRLGLVTLDAVPTEAKDTAMMAELEGSEDRND